METIIPNKEKFQKIEAKLKEEGYENLHVLSDFDRTLTYGTKNGEKVPSVISILRNGDFLTEDYVSKAHDLFDKYHPIEVDPEISLEEKKKAMQEWWETHNELLIKSGLSKTDLREVVENDRVQLRKGVPQFLDFLHQEGIPLVILSASGCGDVIPILLGEIDKDYPNILYVINSFKWNDQGKAVEAEKPNVHCMNKDETVLEEVPEVYKKVEDKKNVILLGDSLGDLGMIKGFDYDNLFKIGFLNYKYNKQEEEYKEKFDVVLKDDGSFDFINNLLKDLKS